MKQKAFQTFYWCNTADLSAVCRGINMNDQEKRINVRWAA